MNKDTYKKSRERFNWREPVRCCYVCGIDDPDILKKTELHHIDGRQNSNEIVELCPNCHMKITEEQNKAPPKSRSKNASINERRGMLIINHAALMKLVAEHQLRLGQEMIEDGKDSTKSLHN